MIYFRADSNPVIAGGHIMRCMTIASALCERGEKVCFLIADENPIPVLNGSGIPYVNLQSDWQDLMTDVDKVRKILMEETEPTLLIDTYRVTESYVRALKPFCKIAYLGSKQEYLGELDLLINYSTDMDRGFYSYHYGEKTKLLLGPSFAPLRKEFQDILPEYRKTIGRILITTGNTDKEHMVFALVSRLLPLAFRKTIVLDVVVGRMFEDKSRLRQMYGDSPNVFLHENVASMSDLMKGCDLAISANGTTVYELSAMGVPTISFAMVEEQVKSAESLKRLGVIDYCGRAYEAEDRCVELIEERAGYYLNHENERIRLAKRAHQLIDGNGCQKIIAELYNEK